MKIGKTSFSKDGWAAFTKLTRSEQKKKLSTLDKSILDKELDKFLKSVPYGKSKKPKSKTKKSNAKQASNGSSDIGGTVEGTQTGEN